MNQMEMKQKMSITAIIVTVVLALMKLGVSCMPNAMADWITRKFAMHMRLADADTTVSIQGRVLEGTEKEQIIQEFNAGQFLKQQHVYPGTEQLFLQPENADTPIIIETKKGKKPVKLMLYKQEDHIDVVKQYKKKVFAYTLRADRLTLPVHAMAGDAV